MHEAHFKRIPGTAKYMLEVFVIFPTHVGVISTANHDHLQRVATRRIKPPLISVRSKPLYFTHLKHMTLYGDGILI